MKQVFTALRGVYGAGKARVTGLFSDKIRPDILKQTLGEHRLMCACFTLALLVFAVCLVTMRLPEKPARYALETHGSEIDFSSPDIKAHTADAGIAVIGGPVNTAVNIEPDIIPTAETPAPVKLTADPAAIWTESPGDPATAPVATANPTHGGFTLPVPMDGDSIGVLTVPDIGLTVRVYEAANEMEAMQKGAAHFKSTSAWEGNIGISAHNVNFDGTPGYFLNLYTLKPGAVIQYATALGTRTYAVESVKEIPETDWTTLGRTQDNRITLITCITGKPAMRLSVQAAEKTAQ